MQSDKRHDSWHAGDSYDAYMGRWSRRIAPMFLSWLGARKGLKWVDVGSGTGALSEAILAREAPASIVGIEPSEGFAAHARRNVVSDRVSFVVGNAEALPLESGSLDIAVSGLVLNFVPDRVKALAEMARVVRPGCSVAFYVWDYPGVGVEFMRAFWDAATELNPAAADLAEARRFPFCTPEQLMALATDAGLRSLETTPLETATVFRDFEDFWHPFTLGAGPAPGYCLSLEPAAREELRSRLEATLPRSQGGAIPLKVRAWGVHGQV